MPIADAAEQRLHGSPAIPVFVGFQSSFQRTNILKIVEIVTNCASPCPEKANMEEMPGVAPHGPARFCETGSAACKGCQIAAPWILETIFYWGDVMHAKTMKAGTILVAGALALGGCTGSQERVAAGGAMGAGAGALLGGAIGGGRGALIGALIGGVAGLVIADAIEKERAREAAYIAARSGGSNVQSFRNSSGQAVIVRARTVRTYNNSSGQRIRVVERSVTREGKAAGTDQVEVNLATNEASGI